MVDEILPLDAFVRAIGVSRGTPHALFLEAGASITSGMPSAQMCIWEWKRSIFLTNNIGLEAQFSELSLASVRTRIQRWLDRQNIYPAMGATDEYGVYVEACFPIPESRRAFFQEKVRHAKPHIGYQLIGWLATQGLVRSVWTTNFDQLVSRALADHKVTPVEVGIDSSHRVVRPHQTAELLIVSLHGDYRYDSLKNTPDELKQQEHQLQQALVQQLVDTPAIVCGYSGRDESVMSTFGRAFGQKGAGALYWCVQNSDSVPKTVTKLIRDARAHGRTAYLVPTQGFDDLMVRVALHCLDPIGKEKVAQLISQNSGGDGARVPFRIDATKPTAILKSNAFEIECPAEAVSFDLCNFPKESVWKRVREHTAGQNIVAVPFKGRIWSLGSIDDIRSTFGDNIKDRPQRTPLQEGDFRYEDGAIICLLRESLIRSMAVCEGLRSDNSHEIWSLESPRSEQLEGESFRVFQSVHLSLRQIEKRLYLVLKPSLRVLTHTGEAAPRDKANYLKLKILGWQHNREFNEAVNFRKKLLESDTSHKAYEYPANAGSPFRFLIRKVPAFAEIFASRGMPAIRIDQQFRPLLTQQGIEISEPDLVFSNRSGTGIARDPHPVRGILNNRPFDYPLTRQHLSGEIRVAVICPQAETRPLQEYLQQFQRQIAPSKHEADYLPTFPGFGRAFGVELMIAEPGALGWGICPEPSAADARANAVEIARNINRAIETLQAAYSPHVVLIFFPDRWSPFRGYATDSERFDVHDFVKAGSVQRGIGTQFLDQSTLTDRLQCRVTWWLSLAFYVKAMRTPWVLEGLDRDTAFVGLGMSVDPSRDRLKRVVMGCSHIYSSSGEGLQYRLSQIENPVFYGKNPFLSREDARRIGEQTRELFFESRSALPRRVVIHKRTRFTNDEKQGLREGLSGVSQIELLEIVIDDTLRYIASSADSRGKIHEDNYPVRRGSVVRLDDLTALLWVHGVTSALSGARRYYQGKRRIPAPLTIRRHGGQSDIRLLAEEILGLSKMNWNTFDLYTKLPATVQSSNEIARIGSLLRPLQPRAYDFRLFI